MNGQFHDVELPTEGTPLTLIGRLMDTPKGKVVVVAHVVFEGMGYIKVEPETANATA